MILLAGGIKGGSGKTTTAVNLAILRASAGQDVLLVDADDQETSADFTALRTEEHPGQPSYTCVKLSGPAVRSEVMRLADRFEDVVIDTGGRDTSSQRAALSVADVLLVPFVPRSFDLWSLEKAAALVEEMRTVNPELRAYCFLNRADPRGSDNSDAADILRETDTVAFLDTPLGQRKAFSNAAAHGLAVTELKPRDPKAIEELTALYHAVFETTAVSV